MSKRVSNKRHCRVRPARSTRLKLARWRLGDINKGNEGRSAENWNVAAARDRLRAAFGFNKREKQARNRG